MTRLRGMVRDKVTYCGKWYKTGCSYVEIDSSLRHQYNLPYLCLICTQRSIATSIKLFPPSITAPKNFSSSASNHSLLLATSSCSTNRCQGFAAPIPFRGLLYQIFLRIRQPSTNALLGSPLILLNFKGISHPPFFLEKTKVGCVYPLEIPQQPNLT